MLAMLKNHATLEKATLRISWLEDAHIIALAEGAPCLVAINVEGAMRVTDISITVVAQHCGCLEFVNVNGTRSVGRPYMTLIAIVHLSPSFALMPLQYHLFAMQSLHL